MFIVVRRRLESHQLHADFLKLNKKLLDFVPVAAPLPSTLNADSTLFGGGGCVHGRSDG